MHYAKIKEPKDGQVVYIHPRQGIRVSLPLPAKREAFERWSLTLYTPFLCQTTVATHPLAETYEFNQLYDLKGWSKRSSVHLGELRFMWRGKRHEGFVPNTTIDVMVILDGKGDDAKSMLTVIDPFISTVRIMPHQVLEVVCFGESGKAGHDISFPQGKQVDIEMELIGRKTTTLSYNKDSKTFNPISGDVGLIQRTCVGLNVNPAIKGTHHEPNPTWNGGLYNASHYYFQMKQGQVKAVNKMTNGNYLGPEISINDYSPSPSARDRLIRVVVTVKGSMKKKLSYLHASRLAFQKFPKVEEPKRPPALISNPKENDTYEYVEGGDKDVTIEIPPPSEIDPTLAELLLGEGDRWKVDIQPVVKFTDHSELKLVKLTAIELDNNAQGWQRFMVSVQKYAAELPPNTNMTLLGQVIFRCVADESMSRTITVFLVARSTSRTRKPVIQRVNNDHHFAYCGSRGRSAPTPPATPTHHQVMIEEVEGTLETHGHTKKFMDIEYKNDSKNTTVNDAAPNQCGGKKKREKVSLPDGDHRGGWYYD